MASKLYEVCPRKVARKACAPSAFRPEGSA